MQKTISAGDHPANEAIMQWRPMLHKLAAAREPDAQHREDLVQETIAAALERWPGYTGQCAIPTWLDGIMRQINGKMFRDRKLRGMRYAPRSGQLRFVAGDREMPKSVEPAQEHATDLARAVSIIGGGALLRVASGERLIDVADAMGITKQRVHQLVVRDRKKLETQLGRMVA